MNTKEKIEVMQAWLDGKTIQLKTKGHREWTDWVFRGADDTDEPSWRWDEYDYRIKPKDPVDEAYDRLTANQQFNRVEVDYESFKLGWEAREEAK